MAGNSQCWYIQNDRGFFGKGRKFICGPHAEVANPQMSSAHRDPTV